MLANLAAFVFNTDLLTTYGYRLLQGLRMTALVVGLSFGIGFVLAILVSRARLARSPLITIPTLAYVTFFRGTPLLCQLYLAYYGAGEIRPFLTDIGIWWFFRDAFYFCIFVFTLNTAAYQSEILRGAVKAVPKGQIEAARALGLSPYRVARHVIGPQALLIALRPLGNELVSIIKSSALAAIVTLLDLMGQTRFIFARTFDFSVYLYAALIYLAMTEAISRLWNWLESKLSRHLTAIRPVATALAPVPASGHVKLDPLRAQL